MTPPSPPLIHSQTPPPPALWLDRPILTLWMGFPHLRSAAAPGDPAVCRHVDGDVGVGAARTEALLSPAAPQPFQVQQVFQLQAAPIRPAAPHPVQGLRDAAADALAGEEAVLLDLTPQRLRDAGLVAGGGGRQEMRQEGVKCPPPPPQVRSPLT